MGNTDGVQPDENAHQQATRQTEPDTALSVKSTLRQDLARVGLYFGLAFLLLLLGLAGLTYRLSLPVEPPGNAGAIATPTLSIATPTAIHLPSPTTAVSTATQTKPAPTRTPTMPAPTETSTMPAPTETPPVATPAETPSP